MHISGWTIPRQKLLSLEVESYLAGFHDSTRAYSHDCRTISIATLLPWLACADPGEAGTIRQANVIYNWVHHDWKQTALNFGWAEEASAGAI